MRVRCPKSREHKRFKCTVHTEETRIFDDKFEQVATEDARVQDEDAVVCAECGEYATFDSVG